MSNFTAVDGPELDTLADWLGMARPGAERDNIREQINGFGKVYDELPAPGETTQTSDRMVNPIRTPTEDEDPYNAWLTKFELERGTDGLLADHRVAIKDCIAIADVPMTWGSEALEDFVPEEHGEVVDAILEAGGTISGKTNLDELTFAPTGEASAFGATRNPRDPDRIAGGSSSGNAAAIAAGDVDLALGTDTGGSVRMPASFCEIVGLKPTFGLVSPVGVFRITYTMDHVGPMAKDVETVARGLAAITPDRPGTAFHENLDVDLADITVAVVPELFATHVEDRVETAVMDAVEAMADAGATVREERIPALAASRPSWWGVAPVEFAIMYATADCRLVPDQPMSADIARGIRQLQAGSSSNIGWVRRGLLLLGAHLLRTHGGEHYVRAQNHRQRLIHEFDHVLETADVIAAPTTPFPALELGEFTRGETRPVNWNAHPTNLTGHPSLSLPCHSPGRLPIGLQLIGAHHDDGTVLDVGAAYEHLR